MDAPGRLYGVDLCKSQDADIDCGHIAVSLANSSNKEESLKLQLIGTKTAPKLYEVQPSLLHILSHSKYTKHSW